MPEPPSLSQADEAALAALADDQLEPGARAALQARIQREPALAAAYGQQQAGLHAITAAAGAVSAPLALRSRVEAMQREAAAPRRHRASPRPDTVLAAATRPPVAAASLDPAQPRLLHDRVETVRFPNYAGKFGWRAEGTRADELGGRDTRTVTYAREGRSMA